MRKSIFVLLFALLYLSTSAQEWGVVRFAKSNVNIRSNRSTSSEVVGKLIMGEKIKADFLQGNWYAVFKTNEKTRELNRSLGFVYAPLLLPNKPSNLSTNNLTTNYKIVEKKDISFQGKSRMVYRIVLNVKRLPSKEEMKKAATKIWHTGNKGWDEFTVFAYLPGMNTQSIAYSASEFNRKGLVEFKVYDYALMGTKWGK